VVVVVDPTGQQTQHTDIIGENGRLVERRSARPISQDGDRSSSFVRNVFVRAFGYLTETGQASVRDWRKYISTFRGSTSAGATRIVSYLAENFRFLRLPEGDIHSPPGKDYDPLDVDGFNFEASGVRVRVLHWEPRDRLDRNRQGSAFVAGSSGRWQQSIAAKPLGSAARWPPHDQTAGAPALADATRQQSLSYCDS
jgi:hypothetical protein